MASDSQSNFYGKIASKFNEASKKVNLYNYSLSMPNFRDLIKKFPLARQEQAPIV